MSCSGHEISATFDFPCFINAAVSTSVANALYGLAVAESESEAYSIFGDAEGEGYNGTRTCMRCCCLGRRDLLGSEPKTIVLHT